MQGKSFFVDLTRCTACRGCQVACKQWNKLPATETKQWGSHQNPADLSFDTYKLVRFTESVLEDGTPHWVFFPEQCRHCDEPPCKGYADAYDEGAIIVDPDTGAVLYTEKTAKVDVTDPTDMCPYNIPRQDPKTKRWSKCTMCNDRVKNGLKPACVQSCPTGAMNFGDREDMLALADKHLAAVRKQYPEAMLVDVDAVRVIYLCESDPMKYYEFLAADAADTPGLMTRKQMLAKLFGPLRIG